jgi:hypothetical protein
LPTSTFAIPFSTKKQGCGPEARALRGKSIGLPISDFELRISDFLGSCFHSAFRNLQSAILMARRSKARLMVFARNVLASRPGNS